MTQFRLALLQHDIAWEAREATLAVLEERIAQAAEACRLVVLSELFAVGFTMNVDLVAEPLHGPTTAWMQSQADDKAVWICGSVPVREPGDDLAANTFVLAGPNGELYSYQKIHPFTYGGERTAYRPGDQVQTFEIEGLRVTPFVCYDLRFADVFWEAAGSTDLYIVPANWPLGRREHWMALLKARAIENQAYVAGCNRVGTGGGLTYVGDSQLVSPLGEVLTSAGPEEAMLTGLVDTEVVAEVRRQYPFQADRRRPPFG